MIAQFQRTLPTSSPVLAIPYPRVADSATWRLASESEVSWGKILGPAFGDFANHVVSSPQRTFGNRNALTVFR